MLTPSLASTRIVRLTVRRVPGRRVSSASTEVQGLDGVDVRALGQGVAGEARVDLAVLDLEEACLGQRPVGQVELAEVREGAEAAAAARLAQAEQRERAGRAGGGVDRDLLVR